MQDNTYLIGTNALDDELTLYDERIFSRMFLLFGEWFVHPFG